MHSNEGEDKERKKKAFGLTCNRVYNAADDSVQNKKKEVFVIFLANTVCDPGAVMVHLEYAFTADGTMVGTRRLQTSSLVTLPAPWKILESKHNMF